MSKRKAESQGISEEGKYINDEYRIVGRCGRGSFGVVHKVEHRVTKKIYAIKPLMPTNNKFNKNTIREFGILYDLSHPNIVKLEEVILYQNQLCLVMEYLPSNLAACMKEPSFKKTHVIKLVIKQILEAVNYLHSHGIIHRDLHPKNVLVDPETYQVKVADFGLARSLVGCVNITPEVGYPRSRAPEILLGADDYGKEADMWSVGQMFAQLANSGEPAFEFCDIDDFSGDLNWQADAQVLMGIFNVLGTPGNLSWPGVTALPNYHAWVDITDVFKDYKKLPLLDDVGNHLLQNLLRVVPTSRLRAEDAVKHLYVQGVDVSS